MATTLSGLWQEVRQRADMEDTQFITDAELTTYINNSLGELYDIMVSQYGADYFVTTYQISTVADTQDYELPSDFYKGLGVDVDVNGELYALERFNFRERNHLRSSTPTFFTSSTPKYKYKIHGSYLRLAPTPEAVDDITLHYIPRLIRLADGADTVSGVMLDNWTEYVVVDSAIKCLIKDESDVSVLMAQKEQLRRRIEMMADDRDAGEPESVTEVFDPYGDFE